MKQNFFNSLVWLTEILHEYVSEYIYMYKLGSLI